jgi:hypothetical protein
MQRRSSELVTQLHDFVNLSVSPRRSNQTRCSSHAIDRSRPGDDADVGISLNGDLSIPGNALAVQNCPVGALCGSRVEICREAGSGYVTSSTFRVSSLIRELCVAGRDAVGVGGECDYAFD